MWHFVIEVCDVLLGEVPVLLKLSSESGQFIEKSIDLFLIGTAGFRLLKFLHFLLKITISFLQGCAATFKFVDSLFKRIEVLHRWEEQAVKPVFKLI